MVYVMRILILDRTLSRQEIYMEIVFSQNLCALLLGELVKLRSVTVYDVLV